MKNLAFIINPISGTQNKRRIPKLIDKLIDKEQWTTDIVFTEYKGHATELAKQYAAMGFFAVVAVGGDGTVNEVASGLVGTSTALGIIPIGSGNGFARHMGISLRIPTAIEALNNVEQLTADYGMVNDKPFFVTCGTGFDAVISEEFHKAGKRGLTTYVQQIIKDVFSYQPEHYHLIGEGIDIETDAFLITFANCNQWGNAAQIAPKASNQDGKMDIAVASKFPMLIAPALALRLFTKTIDDSTYITTLKTKEITLIRETASPFHLDGDPVEMGTELHIRIVEDGLKILGEKRY
ncbi:MAG: YegS/Rv2252/BmrU family lipid kinase [Paludibacteraceae bacterium]|nr:YegS/Rv2252/BmrU family lipid kinase [Paludibacteraceae bacterium]